MKDLLPDDRPREKLRQHGAAALGDNELIALVIGNGSRRGNALTVANALLAAHGGLHELARCTPDELVTVAGIGLARADATKALADADAALHDSRAKLKAAETAHAAARTLGNGRKAIDNGESAVQEARTAFEKGDYLGAIETARSVAGHLSTATRDLDAAAAGGRRRH